ncbi:hypothetical protein X745_08880 [Mesorhizobium sp. LNJC374B00]|nr:hypothetical protein X745_08880 [Mesorhizobium sp. LNJC374B00]
MLAEAYRITTMPHRQRLTPMVALQESGQFPRFSIW